MINTPSSKIIRYPDELRRVQFELISHVINTPVCIANNKANNMIRR